MPTSAAWTCPRCDRRVPPAVDLCRCGAYREATTAALDDAVSTRPTAITALVAVPVLLTLAGATYLWLSPPAAVPASPALISESAPSTPADQTTRPAVAPRSAEPSAVTVPAPAPAAEYVAPAVAAAVPPSAARTAIEDVVARTLPAVVMVETPNSRGTGFFVGPDLLITNDHVAGRAASVIVRLSDGSTHTARVERTVPEVNLAMLRVARLARPPAPLALAEAQAVRPGQEVIAIGSALGLQSTVTRGIVSAKRMAGAVLLLQTDAAINPGNSGGPLLDLNGTVVGVTTLKMGSGAEGLGFAVAADHVRALLDGRPVTMPQTTGAVTPSSTTAPPAFAPGMPAFGADGSAEGQRARGQEAYTRALQQLAQSAAQVDAQWTRFDSTCRPEAARDGDRPWFALASRETAFSARDRNCPYWLADLQRMSREFGDLMQQASDSARRAGVYPGTLRDLRRQARLDWIGFDR